MVDAVITVWGAGRVGVRISPLNSYNDMKDSDPVALTSYVAEQLNHRGIAFLDLMRGDFQGVQKADVVTPARAAFKGALLCGMGYTPAEAAQTVAAGTAEAIVFGNHFVSNPDLVARIRMGRHWPSPMRKRSTVLVRAAISIICPRPLRGRRR